MAENGDSQRDGRRGIEPQEGVNKADCSQDLPRRIHQNSRQFIPYSVVLFVVAFVTTLVYSAYGSPLLFFGFIVLTLGLWCAYRMVPTRTLGLVIGWLLIAICAAQIVFNQDGQIYLLLVVTVDVLFTCAHRYSWIAVSLELLGFLIYRAVSHFKVPQPVSSIVVSSLLDMAIPILLAVALLLYGRAIRQLTEQNVKLERQSIVIEDLALSRERARMASEMHDSIGQYLSAIHLQEQGAKRCADLKNTKLVKHLDAIETTSREALQQVRQEARALDPSAFGEQLTNASVQALADSFTSTSLNVEANIKGDISQLPTVEKTILYRALQETLTNVVRHAKATRACIEVTVSANMVSLVVADDGMGMEPVDDTNRDKNAQGSGYGLSSLSKRLSAIGGTLTIGRDHNLGGSKVSVVIPIDDRRETFDD
ncbi:sensor histidine kinase [Bifidobacterium sp. ESL0769]|uniref:sensor histidine kinase n=1 Tax=Bifidobacterium sp. ESL0769 TaxID=2983229 RepID=UPI0023F90744|nr:sensor histidine kinase [Bifidobacterium sp. ESL0769]WEV68343.1 sensor histidine kinase [Bifidobacterium sp. ESL0769]